MNSRTESGSGVYEWYVERMVGFNWRNCMYIIPLVNLYNSYTFLATKTTNKFEYLDYKQSIGVLKKSNIEKLLLPQEVKLDSLSTTTQKYYTYYSRPTQLRSHITQIILKTPNKDHYYISYGNSRSLLRFLRLAISHLSVYSEAS